MAKNTPQSLEDNKRVRVQEGRDTGKKQQVQPLKIDMRPKGSPVTESIMSHQGGQ